MHLQTLLLICKAAPLEFRKALIFNKARLSNLLCHSEHLKHLAWNLKLSSNIFPSRWYPPNSEVVSAVNSINGRNGRVGKKKSVKSIKPTITITLATPFTWPISGQLLFFAVFLCPTTSLPTWWSHTAVWGQWDHFWLIKFWREALNVLLAHACRVCV